MGAKNHAIVAARCEQGTNPERLAGAPLAPQPALHGPSVVILRANRKMDSRTVAKAKTPRRERRHCRCGTDVGLLIPGAARDRVEGLIERGIADGAVMEPDGRKPQRPALRGQPGPNDFQRRCAGMSIYDQKFNWSLQHPAADTLEKPLNLSTPTQRQRHGLSSRAERCSSAHCSRRTSIVGQVGINLPIPVPVPISFSCSPAAAPPSWATEAPYGAGGDVPTPRPRR